MKIEFENIDEFIEFVNQITINRQPKFAVYVNDEEEQEEEEAITPVDELKTIRPYGATQKQRLPKIIRMNKDGTFKIANAKNSKNIAKWTIKEILIIKSRIPQTDKYPSFNAMSKDLPISTFTTQYLAYGIEQGCFEKYIDEWQQLQANEFYGNWKPVTAENNPQKRKEQGMS